MIPVKRRRILEKIKIDEISAVDKPAMEDALVTIMKRAEPTMNYLNDLEDAVLVLRDRIDVLNKTLADRPERARPSQDFDEVVAAIRKRDNCSGTAAMSEARKSHPALFAQYQKA